MELKVTEAFSEKYDSLSDDEAVDVDVALERLRASHDTAWARRNRVSGDGSGQWDSAWIIQIRHRGKVFYLYWRYYEDEIALVGLVEMDD